MGKHHSTTLLTLLVALLAASTIVAEGKPPITKGPKLTRAQQLLAAYYDGTLPSPQTAAADVVVTAAVGAQQFDWAKPEWGQYRQRAVVHADPAGGGNLTIWAWDIVTEAAVQQALLVISRVVGELHADVRRRLVTSSPPAKVALFKRPEQVFTDIPEHSQYKGTEFGNVGEPVYAGVGGTKEIPVSSCDMRNILETSDDPYREESVLVHEFGHHIHNVGLSGCETDAAAAAYTHAAASGTYTPNIYMISTNAEYMANAVTAWFQGIGRGDVNDGIIDRPRLLARDPTLFSLMQYMFTPSVARMRYRSVCSNCNKWKIVAELPLLESTPPVPLIKLPLEKCIGPANDWRPVPSSAPDCANLDTDCRDLAISGQCDISSDMLTRCQLSCGVCRLVSSSSSCFDRDASCLVAANVQGKCKSDAVGMGPQGMGCAMSCGQCKAAPPSPSPSSPSLCGACASSRCTSRQGCCLNAQRSACSCSSSRGLEPARRGNSSAPIFFCKWALRRPTRLWMVPVDTVVQIPFSLAGPWDADTATATAVCPPAGFKVFIGSRGRNPLGTGLVYSRRTACPALRFNQLVPQEGVGEAELGEYCTNGQSWLMLNVTMPPGAGFEECWSVVMRLTDGTAYNAVFQFYEW
uniref:ShKT domain-containing protein n=1 Tax=Tetradesmus obliquus TaxID=3088 RepID=A0A383VUG7_TETOB|eukprot:jgi/Sobl393_1/9746/SZX68479.1